MSRFFGSASEGQEVDGRGGETTTTTGMLLLFVFLNCVLVLSEKLRTSGFFSVDTFSEATQFYFSTERERERKSTGT